MINFARALTKTTGFDFGLQFILLNIYFTNFTIYYKISYILHKYKFWDFIDSSLICSFLTSKPTSSSISKTFLRKAFSFYRCHEVSSQSFCVQNKCKGECKSFGFVATSGIYKGDCKGGVCQYRFGGIA